MLNTGDDIQFGIVSGGSSDCAAGGVPDVYTDVAAFNSWIEDQIDNDECDEFFGCASLTLAQMIPESVANFFAGDSL